MSVPGKLEQTRNIHTKNLEYKWNVGGTVNLDPLLVERVENECAREVSK